MRPDRPPRTRLATVFRRSDAYIFALIYGSQVDSVRNVLAAGECSMTTRGRLVRLVEPELVFDPARRLVPGPVRAVPGILRVTDVLRMRAVALGRPDSPAQVPPSGARRPPPRPRHPSAQAVSRALTPVIPRPRRSHTRGPPHPSTVISLVI